MYMDYITTTDLRTKSSQLVKKLKSGESFSLIHRSKIIGKIMPDDNTILKTISGKKIEEKIKKLGLQRLTLKEIDRRYRQAMIKKHGKGLS